MHAVIVANAPDLDLAPFGALLAQADLIIAADGGGMPLLRAGVLPQVVIGDLDSLDDQSSQELARRGVELRRFPRAKDETDFELALLLAVARGATSIDVLGALGGRWDHTLANIWLLAHPALAPLRTRLLDDRQAIELVRSFCRIEGQRGDTVSLLPLTATVAGVSTSGLLWSLTNAEMNAHEARGISNVLLEPPGEVRVGAGLLVVVHHDDGGAHQWAAGQSMETHTDEPV